MLRRIGLVGNLKKLAQNPLSNGGFEPWDSSTREVKEALSIFEWSEINVKGKKVRHEFAGRLSWRISRYYHDMQLETLRKQANSSPERHS
jgi:hypothetical protein